LSTYFEKAISTKLKLYFPALSILLGIDTLWLGLVAPKFYELQIGHLMGESANLPAGLLSMFIHLQAKVW
jgi:uncharacterized membrane protein